MKIASLGICRSVLLLFILSQLFPVVGAEMFCVFTLVSFFASIFQNGVQGS